MTNDDRRLRARSALPAALAVTVWLLAGCAPGSGGTGVPTGAASAPDASAPAAAPAPTTTTPVPPPTSAPATAPAPTPATLPATPPLLEGTIDALDTATVVVAGSGFTRSTLRVVLADGSDAPPAAVVVGARLRIWTVTGGHLALLLQ